jgi:sugar phosphate isomerase/epimerase
VWTALLPTTSVEDAVSSLASLGISYVELRQGTLPGYEDPSTHAPDAAALEALIDQFPHVLFSYSFQLPFMTSPSQSGNSSLFASALATSVALAQRQNGVPLLRMVDVATNNKNFNASLSGAIQAALADMTLRASNVGIFFSVENAAVHWSAFWQILQETANFVPPTPLLAFDACNIAWVSDGALGPQVTIFFFFFFFSVHYSRS